jgi:two-component system, cell cycle sensor histidine kinase and response regulator CckA
VRSEGIRALFGQTAPILWANVGVAGIVVAVLWEDADHARLLLWLGALTLLTGARAAFQRRYFQAPPDAADVEAWGRRFVLGSTLSGMLWGSIGVLFFEPGSALSQSLLAFALGGMIAAASSALASHLPAFFGFSAFALGPLTVRAFMEGDRLHLGLGAMLLVYGIGMQRVARANHATFTRAFELGITNAALYEQLAASQVDLEETNRTLEERVHDRSLELERQAEALRKAQRLELVGRLAGGFAHDFNSLLTVVLNNAALLKEQRALDDQGRLAADEMQEAAQRGAALIRQLLAFGGPRRPEPRVLAPDELIAEWGELLERILGAATSLQVSLGAGKACVRLDPAQLEQVLVNLVADARSAMHGEGKLTIATRTLSVSGESELPPGDYVELELVGSGPVGAKDEPRLLMPHFLAYDARDRDASLSSVQSIVEGWGGRFVVGPSVGSTTRARVYIPALPQPVVAPPVRRLEAVATPGATVLVVDDEPTLRSVIRRSLMREGFEVLMAEDGEHAIELAKSHAGPIALLITDVVMPGMSGPELARRLRVERPRLGVLLISGYTFETSLPISEDAQSTAYLSKPFDTRTLSAKVHALVQACARASLPPGA